MARKLRERLAKPSLEDWWEYFANGLVNPTNGIRNRDIYVQKIPTFQKPIRFHTFLARLHCLHCLSSALKRHSKNMHLTSRQHKERQVWPHREMRRAHHIGGAHSKLTHPLPDLKQDLKEKELPNMKLGHGRRLVLFLEWVRRVLWYYSDRTHRLWLWIAQQHM